MSTRSRLAFIVACAAALIAYAALRLGQKIAYSEADPALVIYSEHAAYFWRAWTAAYLGAMVAAAVWLLEEARVARALPRLIVVAAFLLAAQALFLP